MSESPAKEQAMPKEKGKEVLFPISHDEASSSSGKGQKNVIIGIDGERNEDSFLNVRADSGKVLQVPKGNEIDLGLDVLDLKGQKDVDETEIQEKDLVRQFLLSNQAGGEGPSSPKKVSPSSYPGYPPNLVLPTDNFKKKVLCLLAHPPKAEKTENWNAFLNKEGTPANDTTKALVAAFSMRGLPYKAFYFMDLFPYLVTGDLIQGGQKQNEVGKELLGDHFPLAMSLLRKLLQVISPDVVLVFGNETCWAVAVELKFAFPLKKMKWSPNSLVHQDHYFFTKQPTYAEGKTPYVHEKTTFFFLSHPSPINTAFPGIPENVSNFIKQ